MLDIERGPDVDARRQQLLDVLPALGVTRAGGVRMRVFVDQKQVRLARQGCVEVEFQELATLVLQGSARQDLEVLKHGLGLRPTVRLDHPHQHPQALRPGPGGLGQHREGLADPGGHAEEDLEPAATRPASIRQQGVRIGAARFVRCHEPPG